MLKQIAPPATLPLTLAQAKAHLREDTADNDAHISLLLGAATRNAEEFTGRALIDQTWDLYLAEFPASGAGIPIPKPPLIGVLGVFYQAGGVEVTLSPANYTVDVTGLDPAIVIPSSGAWPTISTGVANAVRIRFRAGYLDTGSPPAAAVPDDIRAGILLNLGSLYANRETVVVGVIAAELPFAADALLRPHRVYTGVG